MGTDMEDEDQEDIAEVVGITNETIRIEATTNAHTSPITGLNTPPKALLLNE